MKKILLAVAVLAVLAGLYFNRPADTPAPAPAASAPTGASSVVSGPVTQTCSDCLIDGAGLLKCNCLNGQGARRPTHILARACMPGSIGNIGGALVCTGIIQGSAALSCTDARVKEDTLTMTCRTGQLAPAASAGEPARELLAQREILLSDCPKLAFGNLPARLACE